MTFVDTNVIMYAVGRPHPLRAEAREFFRDALREGAALCTSAEVLQELMHAYLPVDRMATLDAALDLVASGIGTVYPLEPEDVRLARALASEFPALDARDLVHLAGCRRRGITRLKTFDRALGAAASPGRRPAGRVGTKNAPPRGPVHRKSA
jgi:predicted nucleic acid-binding protein